MSFIRLSADLPVAFPPSGPLTSFSLYFPFLFRSFPVCLASFRTSPCFFLSYSLFLEDYMFYVPLLFFFLFRTFHRVWRVGLSSVVFWAGFSCICDCTIFLTLCSSFFCFMIFDCVCFSLDFFFTVLWLLLSHLFCLVLYILVVVLYLPDGFSVLWLSLNLNELLLFLFLLLLLFIFLVFVSLKFYFFW